HAAERNTAIFALRRWLSRNAQQGLLLYDPKNENKKAGLLRSKGFSNNEAAIIYSLLHDFNDQQRNNPATYEALASDLEHKRVAIAELAWWHLLRLAMGVKELPAFNAAAPMEDRKRVEAVIMDLVKKNKLPPPRQPAAKQPEKTGSAG